MLKIDLHTHILPETWPDWTERTGVHGWIRLEHHKPCCARMLRSEKDGSTTFFREIDANCWDPATRRCGARPPTTPRSRSGWTGRPDAVPEGEPRHPR